MINGYIRPIFKDGDVVGFRNLDEYGEPTGRVFTQEEVREAQRKRDRKQGLNTDSE